MKPTTIIVREVDVTPVLHAIERAVLRMQNLRGVPVTEYAKAAMQELGAIAIAKQRYDEAAEAARADAERERAALTEYLTATPPAGRS